jgi:hypothetical protein
MTSTSCPGNPGWAQDALVIAESRRGKMIFAYFIAFDCCIVELMCSGGL